MAKASGSNEALLQRMQGANGRKESAVTQTVKSLLNAPTMQARFREILRDRAPQFMSSIVNLVNSDPNLQKCEPMSVIASCMVAATMDLPIDRNLGYAWIIPYKDGKTGRMIAQFQLGYKGYVQLALRTGQYEKINALPVREGELVEWNPLTEDFKFDPNARKSDRVVGYAGYFRLVNGFQKFVYWTSEEIEEHRKRFAKSGFGWQQDYEAMALKTVLRNMLSKWGILSIEMQKAVTTDEKAPVIESAEDPMEVEWQYIDSESEAKTETEAKTPETETKHAEDVGLDLGIDEADVIE